MEMDGVVHMVVPIHPVALDVHVVQVGNWLQTDTYALTKMNAKMIPIFAVDHRTSV